MNANAYDVSCDVQCTRLFRFQVIMNMYMYHHRESRHRRIMSTISAFVFYFPQLSAVGTMMITLFSVNCQCSVYLCFSVQAWGNIHCIAVRGRDVNGGIRKYMLFNSASSKSSAYEKWWMRKIASMNTHTHHSHALINSWEQKKENEILFQLSIFRLIMISKLTRTIHTRKNTFLLVVWCDIYFVDGCCCCTTIYNCCLALTEAETVVKHAQKHILIIHKVNDLFFCIHISPFLTLSHIFAVVVLSPPFSCLRIYSFFFVAFALLRRLRSSSPHSLMANHKLFITIWLCRLFVLLTLFVSFCELVSEWNALCENVIFLSYVDFCIYFLTDCCCCYYELFPWMMLQRHFYIIYMMTEKDRK